MNEKPIRWTVVLTKEGCEDLKCYPLETTKVMAEERAHALYPGRYTKSIDPFCPGDAD